jgi:2-polyprenyl-3-methyl-5-hydroxy-6-metoxy-1,4-benzoquinol methylase
MNKKRWDSLAKEYHEFIISPFQKGVKNPLLEELKKIDNKKEKTIGEFGCGRLELGEFLSKNFKKVYAFDFSKKMIEEAKRQNKFSNIDIEEKDMTRVKFPNKFDIIISINSIIMPSLNDIKKCLKNIYKSLKKEGKFFLIIPSMESIIYEGMLVLNKELNKRTEKGAKVSTKKIIENKKYDYLLGHYKDGQDTQKFFYYHEILYLLEKTKFKEIKFQKVEYPWKKKISDYEQFPNEKPLWDWFISCKK